MSNGKEPRIQISSAWSCKVAIGDRRTTGSTRGYLSQITPQIAHHYLKYEQGRGIAPKTYNDILKLLRSAFEQLREDGQNPFKKILTQESETIFRKPYTEEELQQILMVSENHPFMIAIKAC